MQAPKVLVVARRFWPFTDDACHRLVNYCGAMQRAGAEITVLTGRWHPSWPEFAICRDVPVHRLLPAPTTNWNESHFQKNVVNWIAKSIDKFDCIYVDRADGLLNTLNNKFSKSNKPIIARFSPEDGGFGISNSQRINQLAMAEACRRCSRIVCPTPYSHRLLVSQGIPETHIARIGDVAWDRVTRSEPLKQAASTALFDTSSDFVVPRRTDIVLHLGIAEPKPLKAAIQAVCDLLDLGVLMRMWIIGCGIPPNLVHDLIKSRGWHREILLFEGFDDLVELIRVADLAIATNPKETLQFTLPTLAMAGVPMFIAENQNCRAWLPDANQSQLYVTDALLPEKLLGWLNQRDHWIAMANSLRQHLLGQMSSDDCTQQWINLFRDSINERTS